MAAPTPGAKVWCAVTEAAILFDPARHEPLAGLPWSEALARQAVTRWTDAAFDAFDPASGWVPHPRDDPKSVDERRHETYYGSGGTIWALQHLVQAGAIEGRVDFRPFVQGLTDRHLPDLGQPQHGTASFLLGEAGLLLLEWKLAPSEAIASRLYQVVQGNLRNPAREQLWGSPGTVLAAIAMAEQTGLPHWAALVQHAVQIIWDEMQPVALAGNRWGWEQDLYGRQSVMLGAGHGFVGNVFPAVRGAALLAPQQVSGFAERALDMLRATALHADGAINWHPIVTTEERVHGKLPLVQDCHGAPGLICRLADMPRDLSDGPAWDALLTAAGELVWRAGPLVKGVALCHGTAGSALALLKLWRRTQDPLWLDRSRALAMHGIQQVERQRAEHGMGRHTLWSGDLGMACVLWSCIGGDTRFPTLDAF